MKPWLGGDFSGTDPRAEMPRVRDTVMAAASRGDDLRPLFAGLAEADPVACAELAAGPKALPHPGAVRGALAAAEALESVLAPSGLYGRLAELAPQAGPDVLHTAAARHPRAEWVIRLSRQFDPVPGRVHLDAARAAGATTEVCAAYARAGVLQGLLHLASVGALEPIAALYRAGHLDMALQAGARALTADPDAPVEAWLAGLHGPDVASLMARIHALCGETAIQPE